jgi:hypothetical protein
MNFGRRMAPLALGTAWGLLSNAALAVDSAWSSGAAKILPTDETVACAYDVFSVGGLFTVKGKLRKYATDGTLVQDNYTDATTKVAAKMQCMDVTTGVYTSPASATGAFGNTSTISCPANGYGMFVKCQIRSTDPAPMPFVYQGGNISGDPCGNGISGIIPVPGSPNSFKGQVSGQKGATGEPVSEMNYHVSAGDKVFNSPLMTTAQVYGTDMGFTFWSGGSLWSGYGDTWADKFWNPFLAPQKRGSVLFKSQDLDPTDGLQLTSFEGTSFAKEIIPCCHNVLFCDEVTAIATAGFGLHEGSSTYRILWFDAIASWFPFTSKVASMAWSVNGSNFARADQTPPTAAVPPKWSNTSNFGAGTVWHDRLGGYVYLFGQRPYIANAPIRLARVPAKFASIMDQTKYEYWSGSAWVHDAFFPLAPSEGTYFGAAANLIPATENPGPEFSVAFDTYSNRFIMLVVKDRETTTAATHLWQSASVTGPWTQVTTGASTLANAAMTGGTVAAPYPYFYGPYTSEQLMPGGGQSVYYQLSEWNGANAVKPYNTGLWGFNVTRTLTPHCVP